MLKNFTPPTLTIRTNSCLNLGYKNNENPAVDVAKTCQNIDTQNPSCNATNLKSTAPIDIKTDDNMIDQNTDLRNLIFS